MDTRSSLIVEATRLFDHYRLADLPRGLQRNSLDYYYLSIYPSLTEMRSLSPAERPPYPARVNNAYIHVPFCSGVCDFCSYYLVALNARRRDAIARYLERVKVELDYHARHTTLDFSYLYFGGGTPSLIPPEALADFLGYLSDRLYLNPAALGTIELHPEFFTDEGRAVDFIAVLKRFGIGRVSVGYQVSDEDLLRRSNRRHTAAFMSAAMELLRNSGFLINIDLMYGLPDQSLSSWERSLIDAFGFGPDSIATYYLFVDRGTGLFKKVQQGEVSLPDHQHIQIQHLMAQVFLERAGYHELPNDFWARGVTDPANFRPERLPSEAITLPVGPGAYGYYSHTQMANVFDLDEYARRIAAGESPVWRGFRLLPDEAFHRDVMFSLKNEPFIDCKLFENAYNRNPLSVFEFTFDKLRLYGLVMVEGDRVNLTSKGRLCVEEIASLFRHPNIGPTDIPASRRRLLEKHNFAPTYPPVGW